MLIPGRPLVEVAVDSVATSRVAAQLGADRLELCQDLELGGTTPSLGLLERVRATVTIPVFAMVRSRPGSFQYDDDDIAVQVRDIEHLRRAGCDGVVIGPISGEGSIARESVERCVAAAGNLPVTFHRAFDQLSDPDGALAALATLGVKRILTSGGADTAFAGRAAIRGYVAAARGNPIVVAGGGVVGSHLAELIRETEATEVHLSGSERTGGDSGFGKNPIPARRRLTEFFAALAVLHS